MTEIEFKERMKLFGRKLRSYAKWECIGHYYSTKEERTIQAAKQEMAEAIATMIDETFEVDSTIHGKSREEDNGR